MFQLDFLPAATIEHVIETVILFAPRILIALLTLLIGNWLIRVAVNLIERAFRVRNIDESLQSFLASLLSIGLKVILVITAAGLLGFETTSFVAILGASSLAVGLALQGSLANFAGGVLLLIFKPYKIGDKISAQGQLGNVTEIQIFNTLLETPDGKMVVLPNGMVSNGIIINLSAKLIRVDIELIVDYKADVAAIRDVLLPVLASIPHVATDPAPSVNILKMADQGLQLTVRTHTLDATYWDVFFAMQNTIKAQIDAGVIKPADPIVKVETV